MGSIENQISLNTLCSDDETDQPMASANDNASSQPPKHRHARRRGQGLVELALISPLMVFMLMATVDFARAYTAYIDVSNAARAGAIYGSRSTSNANDSNAVSDAALADSPSIFGTAPTVSSSTATDADGYEQITVTVDYTFAPITGFPGIPDSIDLTRTVQMRVVG